MPSQSLSRSLLIILITALLLSSFFFNGLLTQSSLVFTITLIFIGGLLGATLNYFHFGFSSSFRSLISERKTLGMRAIVIMLGVAIVLFSLIISSENINQQNYSGFVRPLSLSIPIGAFIFGIGMQISCGCTSGTLNRLGQLQPLALPTLLFMILGGTLAAFTFGSWQHLPAIEPFAFQQHFNWTVALILQIFLLIGLWFFFAYLEKQKYGKVEPLFSVKDWGIKQPFLIAALSLAILNALLFLISGSPWSISSVFPFWGTKIIDQLSLPVDWAFWDYAMENQTNLSYHFLDNPVSLTTIGVILGALVVTLSRKSNRPKCAKKALIASSLGGLIMGYSAVLASGCNIGAFFSGIASGSLHGWVWFVFAFFGNWLGIVLRNMWLNSDQA